MRNLYNPVHLTIDQKIAYLRILVYLSRIDNTSTSIEKSFLTQFISRMNVSQDILKNIYLPRNIEELYKALMPICTREIAIDLLHCLWFAATVDSIITNEKIEIIRKIAQILRIDNDTLLNIHHFVIEEIAFLQHACEVLEANDIRC